MGAGRVDGGRPSQAMSCPKVRLDVEESGQGEAARTMPDGSTVDL